MPSIVFVGIRVLIGRLPTVASIFGYRPFGGTSPESGKFDFEPPFVSVVEPQNILSPTWVKASPTFVRYTPRASRPPSAPAKSAYRTVDW
jgi:hypothetical protein